MKRITIKITFFLKGYKHDYEVTHDGDESIVEGVKKELSNLFSKIYESQEAGKTFKITFAHDDKSKAIYLTECVGAEYTITTKEIR